MKPGTFVASHQGLLGTDVELRIHANRSRTARQAEHLIVDEIARLERVFNAYDDTSELSLWRRDEAEAGPELAEVLRLALGWQEWSGGAFNVAVGALTDLWARAADRGLPPSGEELAHFTTAIRTPGYVVAGDAILRTAPVSEVNLSGIAKGWIVDRAGDAAFGQGDLLGLTVNAGGDLRHWGETPIVVGIEDPRRPFDNVAPLLTVSVQGCALATSGGSRRGWRIGETRYGHVLDPRTGSPANEVASTSVVARDAATADVVATTLTVLGVDGIPLVEVLDGVACCLVDRSGDIHRSEAWGSREVRGPQSG